jgi:hypothetical protein
MIRELHLSAEAMREIQGLKEPLIQAIEAKRDPKVVYAFKAAAFVTQKILVWFQGGLPESVLFNGHMIASRGAVSFNQIGEDDAVFSFDTYKFNEYVALHKDFILEVDQGNDGCVTWHVAKVHGTLSDEYDFSIFE